MKEPKTKPKAPLPKILKRSIHTLKGMTSLNKSMNNFRKKAVKTLQQPEDKQFASPEQYATEKASEIGGRMTRQMSGKTINDAKKIAKKGYEKVREQYQIKQRDKAEKTFRADSTYDSVGNQIKILKALAVKKGLTNVEV